MRQLAALTAVMRDRRLRRLVIAFGCFSFTEFGTWLAVTVYAFERGGVRETGIAAFAQLAPAAAIAPLAAYAGDRFRRDLVLAGGLALVGVLAFVTGVAMLADLPGWVVYVLGAGTTSAMTVARPAVGAIMPALSDVPGSLTAANCALGLVESFGVFAGPAVGGAMLAIGPPGLVFVVLGASSVTGAVLVLGIGVEPARMRPTGTISTATVRAEMRSGFATVRHEPGIASTAALLAVGFFVTGAMDVLFVAVAFESLAAGDGTAGVLSAMAGVGGIFGAGASISLVGMARLRPALVGAALLAGLPLLLLTDPANSGVAVLAVGVAGAGLSLLAVACRTLVQRATRDDVLVRVLGVLEGSTQLGLALGALAVGVIASAAGLAAAVVTIALALPACALLAWTMVGGADDAAVRIEPELLDILRADDLFAMLGAAQLERLASNLRRVRAEPGDEVIRMGEVGDRFYIIVDGMVDVSCNGVSITRCGPGQHIGEIALVLDVPRTATVTAITPTTLYGLGRTVFLEAVTGHPQLLHDARRLAADPRPGEA